MGEDLDWMRMRLLVRGRWLFGRHDLHHGVKPKIRAS